MDGAIAVLSRQTGYLVTTEPTASPDASRQLQGEGWALVPGVLSAAEVAALATEIDGVFEALGPDNRAMTADEAHYLPFRYEMLNRSPLSQVAIARREILDVVEPLLGEDCHVIANTAWRQGAGEVSHHGGLNWHMDAGPHVPRPPGISWDQRIPYPIFAVACHIFLQDCPIECGPTGVIPRSHMSGQAPPKDRRLDDSLNYEGVGVLPILAAAGDVALFVSDVWHRRMPPQPGDPGRFFLQVHYGRRDIAQRLRTTAEVNQLSAGAVARAVSPRDRTLIGLHPPRFYDG